MFGMSLSEILIIAVLALIVFGPERIPKVARTVGGFIREMRRASAEVQRHLEIEDIRRELRERNQEMKSAFSDVSSAASSTLAAASAPLPSSSAHDMPASSSDTDPSTREDDALATEDEAIAASLRAYLAEGSAANATEEAGDGDVPLPMPTPGAPVGTVQHEEAS